MSLLDSLKSPTAADIAQKRQTKTNPPPIGKRQCRGNAVSDPRVLRHVSASRSFFPNELLKVSGGKFFWAACREELGLKRRMLISKRREPILPVVLTVNSSPLERVDAYKYLGSG